MRKIPIISWARKNYNKVISKEYRYKDSKMHCALYVKITEIRENGIAEVMMWNDTDNSHSSYEKYYRINLNKYENVPALWKRLAEKHTKREVII